MPIVWKRGVQVDSTIAEFTQQLRHFARYADEQFSRNSNPAAHLAERLNAAADEIDRLAHKYGEQ